MKNILKIPKLPEFQDHKKNRQFQHHFLFDKNGVGFQYCYSFSSLDLKMPLVLTTN